MKLLAIVGSLALLIGQPQRDLAPLPGSRLIQTSRIDSPLELKSANADDEAVLAGLSYVKNIYDGGHVTPSQFVTLYRDSLFAAGWKLISSTKVDAVTVPEGVVSVAAHYLDGDRNIYALVSRTPEGPYEVSVADVGAEDWAGTLVRECRLHVPSLHFDLDRPTLREFESKPTLAKLATLLKMKSVPAVEIQGHMDNIGETGAAARQVLSDARARTVAAWLTAHGVSKSKISAKGYGKTRPIADNDSDLGRAMNRRIEVSCLRRQ